MKTLRITLKNYRPFTDSQPLYFELAAGFTAILGPNNAGKSALKLFFYEFREVFQELVNDPNKLANPLINQLSVGYKGVSDNEEVFNTSNTRPLTATIEVVDPQYHLAGSADCFSTLVLTVERAAPTTIKVQIILHESKAKFKGSVPKETKVKFSEPGVVRVAASSYDFTDLRDALSILANSRYYGSFRNAVNQGAADYFDLKIGTAFIDLWEAWKTSGVRKQSRGIDSITEDIRRLFEFDRLEINASSRLKTLMVSVDGQPHRLTELGSGIAQFIITLGNAATAPPPLLFIDEPETNLHPALQLDFLLAIAQHVQYGVVFSTHSVGLARSIAGRIYSAQRTPKGTLVRPFEATNNYIEFIGSLSFSTFKDLGSDRILLVEGVTDVKVVQQFLRLIKKEHQTVILQLGGDGMACGGREIELYELTRLSGNIAALVDSERESSSDAPAERRSAFAQTCESLGIKVCLTERRAMENYFTQPAITAALGGSYQALGPFERLDQATKSWSKSDNWKIARHITPEELRSTDIGKFLSEL